MFIKSIKINYLLLVFIIFLLLSCSFLLCYTYQTKKGEEFPTNAKVEEGIKLPIIMYHSILKDQSRSGKYVITPDMLKQDLEYISSKGYTTITMTDLIRYVYDDAPLPEKPIIITFDDGDYNNYGYAVPILKELNMKAVFSIVGEYTNRYSETGETNLNYSYMRWEDIKNALEE